MQVGVSRQKREKHLFRASNSSNAFRRGNFGTIAMAAMVAFGSQSAANAMENGFSPLLHKSNIGVSIEQVDIPKNHAGSWTQESTQPQQKPISQAQNNNQIEESPLKDAVPHHSVLESADWQGMGAEIGRRVGLGIRESDFAEFASRMCMLSGNRGCYTYHFFIVAESEYQKMSQREKFGLKLKTRENMLGWFGAKDEQTIIRILDEMDKLPAFQGRNFGSWWRTNVSFNDQDRKFAEEDAKELAIRTKAHEEKMQNIEDKRKRQELAKNLDEFGSKLHLDDVFNWLQGIGLSQTWASAMTLLGLLAASVAIPLLIWKTIRRIIRKVGDSMRKNEAEKLKAELKNAAEHAKKGVVDIDEVLPAFEKAEKRMIAFRERVIKKFGEKEGWEKIEKMGIGRITHDEYNLTITTEDAYFLKMCTICLVNVREKLRKTETREEFSKCTDANSKIYARAEERGKRVGTPDMVAPLKAYRLSYQSAWREAMRRILGEPGMKFWKSYDA